MYKLASVIAVTVCLFSTAVLSQEKGMTMDHSMHSTQSETYSDRAFLSGMIPHHEAAVVMAGKVIEEGKDRKVRSWAEAVIKSQNEQIDQMRDWLVPLGGVDKAAAGSMQEAMDKMNAMPSSKDVDRDFVSMMVPHHAGALEMSIPAVQFSKDKKIVQLAETIIKEQAEEIVAFRDWLRDF